MSRCRAPTSPSARVPPQPSQVALHEAVPQGTPEDYPNKPSVVHNGSTGDENCELMAVNNPVRFMGRRPIRAKTHGWAFCPFIGLGAVLIGIGLVYQKLVFRRSSQT